MMLSDGGTCADGTCTGEGHEEHKGAMPAAPTEGSEATAPAEGGEKAAAPAKGSEAPESTEGGGEAA